MSSYKQVQIPVCLSDFLIGEGKLENYLEDHPPIETNINKAKLNLIDAKRYLNLVITEAGIKVQFSIMNTKSTRLNLH